MTDNSYEHGDFVLHIPTNEIAEIISVLPDEQSVLVDSFDSTTQVWSIKDLELIARASFISDTIEIGLDWDWEELYDAGF